MAATPLRLLKKSLISRQPFSVAWDRIFWRDWKVHNAWGLEQLMFPLRNLKRWKRPARKILRWCLFPVGLISSARKRITTSSSASKRLLYWPIMPSKTYWRQESWLLAAPNVKLQRILNTGCARLVLNGLALTPSSLPVLIQRSHTTVLKTA